MSWWSINATLQLLAGSVWFVESQNPCGQKVKGKNDQKVSSWWKYMCMIFLPYKNGFEIWNKIIVTRKCFDKTSDSLMPQILRHKQKCQTQTLRQIWSIFIFVCFSFDPVFLLAMSPSFGTSNWSNGPIQRMHKTFFFKSSDQLQTSTARI